MKKVLITIVALFMCIAAKSQSLYELKYYDIIDKTTYQGLFFFTDEENCHLRCVTEPNEKGEYGYWDYDYHCEFEKEDGVNYLYFIPEARRKDDDPLIPAFIMAYNANGEFQSQTYAIFADMESEEELTDDNTKEVEFFREINLRDKDEDYFQQYYEPEDDMYKQIMSACNRLNTQDDGSDVSVGSTTNANGPVTMHLLLVAATLDESIGRSVVTDVNLVKKNFSDIAKKLNIGYKETVISGNDFNTENVADMIDNFKPASNDIVVFVYSGHGFRFDDDTDAYPRMSLTYGGNPNEELSTTDVYNELVSKNARLTIFLTDCCNSRIGITRMESESIAFGTRATNNNTDLDKLYDLFIDESGTVRATAAKAGQYALCDASGGFMLTSILNNIKSQTSALAKDAPSWKVIVDNASRAVAKKTSNQIDEAGNETDPQVVVRAIKVRDLGVDRPSSLSSNPDQQDKANKANKRSSQNAEDEEDDPFIDFLCIAIPIIAILALVVIIIMLLKKKKK
ncbi:MAG: caspase family protein [Bacteroidales bacterium]|nr:caspase family protein [Bacteroidales bacterium]